MADYIFPKFEMTDRLVAGVLQMQWVGTLQRPKLPLALLSFAWGGSRLQLASPAVNHYSCGVLVLLLPLYDGGRSVASSLL
jgi:hypothetical protein